MGRRERFHNFWIPGSLAARAPRNDVVGRSRAPMAAQNFKFANARTPMPGISTLSLL
ncbi:hypothetical protein RPYSC3_43860 [Rhodopseudomonas palustris]|nr:hypothetical protein RPYSC3_43860 [Rhodopseudomonas palustris]